MAYHVFCELYYSIYKELIKSILLYPVYSIFFASFVVTHTFFSWMDVPVNRYSFWFHCS
jgi:hypothetical protein